ncbi:MAG: hypothetical protein KDA44_04240 [Planctomycetales bacterium]|nr:hypothetical protein [Planctomycetales bacterium]
MILRDLPLIAGPELTFEDVYGPAFGGLAAVAWGVTAIGCANARLKLRGTTLAAPAAWAAVAAAVLAIVEATLASRGDSLSELTRSAWRFAAAAGTFCPPMAVLGAKRPQDRGWQWIVASLWVVIALPAIQTALTPAGDRMELSVLWTGFLLVIAAYGAILNYGPTRFIWASALYFLGQAALIAPATKWQPALPWFDNAWACLGALLLLAAWIAARVASGRAPERFGGNVDPATLQPTARWLAFRDAYGLSWGLRVLHRVNETAALAGWPVRLAWHGFVDAAALAETSASAVQEEQKDLSPETAAAVHATLDSLLRRFERNT